MVKDLLALGLSNSSDLMLKLMSIVWKLPLSSLDGKYKVTLKDLQKLCTGGRLVNRLLKILNESVKL